MIGEVIDPRCALIVACQLHIALGLCRIIRVVGHEKLGSCDTSKIRCHRVAHLDKPNNGLIRCKRRRIGDIEGEIGRIGPKT